MQGDSIDLQSAQEELVMAEEDGKDRHGIEYRNHLPQLGRLEEKQEEAKEEEKKISAIF